jgi:tRNA pseudouridine38-40 synthase
MKRIRLTVAYDGTEFHGWQVQPGLPTIQWHLEEIVSDLERKHVSVAGSGRTDAGVHALAQVAAISIQTPIPLWNLKKVLNRQLPQGIRVLLCEEVPLQFHPRFDAVSKTYEYRTWRGEVVSPFEHRYMHHHPFPMSDEAFCDAARLFAGTHNFSAFAATDDRYAQGRNMVRTIFASEAWRDGDMLLYRVTGSGFLKHMVRNIVGTLIEAGKGNADADRVRWLLSAPPGAKAIPSAPPCGLFLVKVNY